MADTSFHDPKLLPNEIFNGEEVNVIYNSRESTVCTIHTYSFFSSKTGLLIGNRTVMSYSNGLAATDTSITVIGDYQVMKGTSRLMPLRQWTVNKDSTDLSEHVIVEWNVNIDPEYFRNEIFANPEQALDRIFGAIDPVAKSSTENESVFPLPIPKPSLPYIFLPERMELLELQQEERVAKTHRQAGFQIDGISSGAFVDGREPFKLIVKLPTANEKKLFLMGSSLVKCEVKSDHRFAPTSKGGAEIKGFSLKQIARYTYEIVPEGKLSKGEYVFSRYPDYTFRVE